MGRGEEMKEEGMKRKRQTMGMETKEKERMGGNILVMKIPSLNFLQKTNKQKNYKQKGKVLVSLISTFIHNIKTIQC